jgi:hypothetical protein
MNKVLVPAPYGTFPMAASVRCRMPMADAADGFVGAASVKSD